MSSNRTRSKSPAAQPVELRRSPRKKVRHTFYSINLVWILEWFLNIFMFFSSQAWASPSKTPTRNALANSSLFVSSFFLILKDTFLSFSASTQKWSWLDNLFINTFQNDSDFSPLANASWAEVMEGDVENNARLISTVSLSYSLNAASRGVSYCIAFPLKSYKF